MLSQYHSIRLPSSIILDSFIYVPVSLLDIKRQKVGETIVLRTGDSLDELVMAPSMSAKEYHDLNLSLENTQTDFTSAVINSLVGYSPEFLTTEHVDNFNMELLHLTKIFHEEMRGISMPASLEKFYTKRVGKLFKLEKIDEANPFTVRQFMERYFATSPSFSRNSSEDSFHAQSLQKIYQTLLDSTTGNSKIPEHLHKGKEDVLSGLVDVVLDGEEGLLHIDAPDEAYRVMRKTVGEAPKRTRKITIVKDGQEQHYHTEEKFNRDSFNQALSLLTEYQLMRGASIKKSITTMNSSFPFDFDLGKIHLDDNSFRISLLFPTYAVINPQEKDMVFMFDEGQADFWYSFNLTGESVLRDYSVVEKGGGLYTHFFTPSSNVSRNVCGYKEVKQQNNRPFSEFVWENFIEMHAVLTDGLKGDNGYRKISQLKHDFLTKHMNINGETFLRYTHKELIEQYNKNKPFREQIYIGNGTIK